MIIQNREYRGEFHKWKDVLDNFGGECPKVPPRYIFAEYQEGTYEGSSTVITSNNGEDFNIIEASHCSCYGLEGQWEPTKHKKADIKKMIKAEYGFFHDHKTELAKWLKHIADIVQQ